MDIIKPFSALRICNSANPMKRRIRKTGVLLGMFEDETWEQATVQIDPGEVLVLYTDGVTEAANPEMELFGKRRLEETVAAEKDHDASSIQKSILASLVDFRGSEPQLDDIALVVVSRDPE